MYLLKRALFFLGLIVTLLITSPKLKASEQGDRLILGGGLIHLGKTSETHFTLMAEYERRLDQLFGLGGQANYIFSSPSIALVALPTLFLHPLPNDFLINASPLFEFGAEDGTHFGARVGTRLPIHLGGSVAIIPSLGLDFIAGNTNYILGLALQF